MKWDRAAETVQSIVDCFDPSSSNTIDLAHKLTPLHILFAVVVISLTVWFFNRAKGAMLIALTAALYTIPAMLSW